MLKHAPYRSATADYKNSSALQFASALGQGALLMSAITIMLALVIGGYALSGLSQMNATRSVVTKQSLQTYYAAQAGIQEALASRMVPRSNYENFDTSTDLVTGRPVSQKAYYSRSGSIYQNLTSPNPPLIAKYRYIVLGGDSAKHSNGSWYAASSTNNLGILDLLATDTIPNTSPFIVVSQGITCVASQGSSTAKPNAIQPGINPTCASGTQKDEVTLVAVVRLIQEPASTGATQPMDKVEKMRVVKDSTLIPLPYGAFVPGYGWKNANETVNFQTMWAYRGGSTASTQNEPLLLKKVVFYSFVDGTIDQDCTVQGASTMTCSPGGRVPSNDAIRLYFNGPIDPRSISPAMDLSDRSLVQCAASPSKPYQPDQCHIRVVPNPPMNSTNHAYNGNTIIPLMPGTTQVILLPPLVALTPNRLHQLEVDIPMMRTYSNSAGPAGANYRLRFTTQ